MAQALDSAETHYLPEECDMHRARRPRTPHLDPDPEPDIVQIAAELLAHMTGISHMSEAQREAAMEYATKYIATLPGGDPIITSRAILFAAFQVESRPNEPQWMEHCTEEERVALRTLLLKGV
jgi:hypothetical protein